MKGFDPKWCQWINNFMNHWSVGVKVNKKKVIIFRFRKD
jgi:hypothetical protein